MIIKPLLTEKTVALARDGKYTFLVTLESTKTELKKEAKNLFDVDVVTVKTVKSKPGKKKTMRGVRVSIKAQKKAILEVKGGQKIELFEEKKEKKAKKK